MSPIVPVILSGGAGTRLWPLSREPAPKPFMPLPDGETLLGKTAHRAIAIPGVARPRHRHQPRLLLPHEGRLRGTGRARAHGRRLPAGTVRPQHGARGRGGGAAGPRALRRRRGHAGARRRSPDPRRSGLRARGGARRGTRARGQARHVRHHADAAGNRIRLHRMRRVARRARVRRRAVRRKAAAREGARLPRRRQLRLELGDVRVHGGHDPRRAANATRRRSPWPRARCGSRWRRVPSDAMLEIDPASFAAAPGPVDRLRGDGKGRDGRPGGGGARRLRLERRRLVAGGVGTVRRRRGRQPRQRRARGDRHARHVRPLGGPRSSRRSASRTSSSSTRPTRC